MERDCSNVQVTLQIVMALIEKCPRELPLYAHSVLNILGTILKSNDVTMVEDSVATFEAFCSHQEPATLAADQEYEKHYEEIVRYYASFAAKDTSLHTKTPISIPVAIRFRSAGLRAIKGIAASDSLLSDSRNQLELILPTILQNIYSKDGKYLLLLQQRERAKVQAQKEEAVRRRTSLATVRTFDVANEADPIAASGTTADADKLAEEEVGVLALQCLRHVFNVSNRGQIRLATYIVLKFISSRVKPREHFMQGITGHSHDASWPTTLFEMISRWAPVQDRFLILVTTMDTLVRSPILEHDLEKQLVLAVIVDWLLSSDLNLIGLSVMDVLIGLVQHTLLLLQLGGNGSGVRPHHQQADGLPGVIKDVEKSSAQASPAGQLTNAVVMEVVENASNPRRQLLDQIQHCIGALATHIYYSDQIPDMVSALLMRLKPPAASAASTAAAAIEDPAGAVEAIADSVHLQEKPGTDSFFSFDTARLTALAAVKDILTVANSRRDDGHEAVGRNRVGVGIWDGTQWLLRDPNGDVRKAYVDALLTWLTLELGKRDLRIVEEPVRPVKRARKEGEEATASDLARRAVSNASQRGENSRLVKSTFLQLLHLAVYEHVLSSAESEPDVLLVHLLLATLVQKLGVNAVRFGLPMILRLQEDIQAVRSPLVKVRIGSVVHGYFWAICESLDLDTSTPGQEIQKEISRRQQHGLWTESIKVPPVPLQQIDSPSAASLTEKLPLKVVQSEFLKPFDRREQLVESIAEAYTSSISSPPASPPGSPGRSFSLPAFNWGGTAATPANKTSDRNALPNKVREQMMSDWSRESCIATVELESNKAISINGSKTGTGSGSRNLLAPGAAANGDLLGHDSENGAPQTGNRRSRPPSRAYGLMGGGPLENNHRAMLRRLSLGGDSPQRSGVSSSSQRSFVRVEDLKRVLAGEVRVAPAFPTHTEFEDDSASESMRMSAEGVESEMSFPGGVPRDSVNTQDFTHSGFSRPDGGARGGAFAAKVRQEALYTDEDIPPVPPLPAGLAGSSSSSMDLTPRRTFGPGTSNARPQSEGNALSGRKRSMSSNSKRAMSPAVTTAREAAFRGTHPLKTHKERPVSSWSRMSARTVDLDDLLGGIDTGKVDGLRRGGLRGKAPY